MHQYFYLLLILPMRHTFKLSKDPELEFNAILVLYIL